MDITNEAVDLLARTVYGEARGEGYLGQLAVAHVIVNRAKRGGWWGKSVPEVCLKPSQFSCWNTSDPNRVPMLTANLSHKQFAQCYRAALSALHGLEPDPTGGACHYLARGVETDWSHGQHYESIGGHKFYRGIE